MTDRANTEQTILDRAGPAAIVSEYKGVNILAGKGADNQVRAKNDKRYSEFYNHVIACIRTLSNDTTLTFSVGEEKLNEECDINLPQIDNESNKSLVVLVRGLGDSFSMMRLHHDPQLHNRLAPKDPVADRLFTLLERERFEAVGARQFMGVARNLESLWTLSHGADVLGRFGPAEQLEFVLSCLCREKIGDTGLPIVAERFIASMRGPVEDLLGERFCVLSKYTQQQYAFAEHTLSIIARLGFDITPKIPEQSLEDGVENSAQNNSRAQAQESDESAQDDDAVEQTTDTDSNSEPKPEIDGNAEATDQAELVRNADITSDYQEELEDLDGRTIIETTGLVGDSAANCFDAKNYRVFDRSNDEVCTAKSLIDTSKLKALRKDLDAHVRLYEPMIGQLAARLQTALLSRQKRSWLQDYDEGELDPHRLTRVIVSPQSPLTYRIHADSPVRDTTVCLLIDNSRSMFGKPIAIAASCADLITRVLERCGVSTEVLGFTTVTMYGGAVNDQWQAQERPADAGRLNSVRHVIYKSAPDSWRRSRDNFGLMLDKHLLKQNIDGEALQWARQRLMRRPEKRRIMIVISDGMPSDSYTLKSNHRHYLRDHLDHVVAQIERRSAIELVGIGIGHQLSYHYRRSFNIDDVEQLGPILFSELSRLLRH